MFWLRAAVVSISAFMLAYCAASIVVATGWRTIARTARIESAQALFALRMLPLIFASTIVAAVAIPSFLQYEPRQVDEAIGVVPLLLCAAFAVLVTCGTSRTVAALRHARRAMRVWTCGARSYNNNGVLLVTSPGAPAMALAGIRKAQLVVSAATQAALTPAELERAIAHEHSHRRAGDNLKKLLLRACAFPGMAALDRAWLAAIELSADAEAVHSHAEALDLASALVKIARLHDGRPLPRLVSGFVDGPAASLETRVQRLLRWSESPRSPRSNVTAMLTTFAFVLLCACDYPALLHTFHSLTEILVR
jgi:Zn-dependent protease with chaperone function